MAEEASEKQLQLLKKLTGKDYAEFNLTGVEASRKIKEAMGDREEAKGKGQSKYVGDSPEKIASIEAQTAYNGLIQLIIAGKATEDCAKRVVDWGLGKLNAKVSPTPKITKPIAKEPETANGEWTLPIWKERLEATDYNSWIKDFMKNAKVQVSDKGLYPTIQNMSEAQVKVLRDEVERRLKEQDSQQ